VERVAKQAHASFEALVRALVADIAAPAAREERS
jgi:hypothetical protein